jgi:hypothetical protein
MIFSSFESGALFGLCYPHIKSQTAAAPFYFATLAKIAVVVYIGVRTLGKDRHENSRPSAI